MAGLDDALAPVAAWITGNVLVDTVRISLPATGDPVLNETTGQLEYPEPEVLYEGPGAVQPLTTDITAVPNAGLPWVAETKSRYQLLTPLDAPVAPKDATVKVTAVHEGGDPALLRRSWRCQDPSRAATLAVVRATPLDQNQQSAQEVP